MFQYVASFLLQQDQVRKPHDSKSLLELRIGLQFTSVSCHIVSLEYAQDQPDLGFVGVARQTRLQCEYYCQSSRWYFLDDPRVVAVSNVPVPLEVQVVTGDTSIHQVFG